MSARFTTTRWDRGFASGLPCQAPSEGTPQSAARGTLRSRDRAAAGMSRPRQEPVRRLHPAAGSHLPSEDTAPPSAVVPFAASPFAHPIPQSHRRASGALFRGSLVQAYGFTLENQVELSLE
jgi:hypothetical protein